VIWGALQSMDSGAMMECGRVGRQSEGGGRTNEQKLPGNLPINSPLVVRGGSMGVRMGIEWGERDWR